MPQWRAWFWKKSPEDGTGPHIIEEAPTAPHAICLAALNAVGVEVSN